MEKWRGKGVSSAIRRKRANTRSINNKDSCCLYIFIYYYNIVYHYNKDPFIVRVGVKRREREEVESSGKDKRCLIEMMTPLPACRGHREKEYQTGSNGDPIPKQ